MNLHDLLAAIQPYLPGVGFAAVIVVGVAHLYATHRLEGYARATVSAVYRVALKVAAELADEGLAWLRSPAGVAFRKNLAGEAYNLLPAQVGPLPVGLVKLWVSQEQWCSWVEAAFQEAVELASKLELPLEVDVTLE